MKVNLYYCVYDMMFMFFLPVDVRNAGEGQLEIMVNNGNLPNSVESDVTGVYRMSFVPETAGEQNVEIIFNKESHPGMNPYHA